MTLTQWVKVLPTTEREPVYSVMEYAGHVGFHEATPAEWTERYRRALNACAVNLGAVARRYQCNVKVGTCTTRGANPGACARHTSEVRS